MISIQEMTAWTARDIEAAIYAARPAGWRFTLEVDRGIYSGTFTDDGGNVAWMREGIDERVVLFDALGWLQRRQAPVASEVWRRKRGEIPRPRQGTLTEPEVRMSHITDPEEAAVYRRGHSRRK